MTAPRSNFMLCWERQERVIKAQASAVGDTGYEEQHLLNNEVDSIWRRTNDYPYVNPQLDFRLGRTLVGLDHGPPETDAPAAAVTREVYSPNNEYLFVVGGGYSLGFAAFRFNPKRGTFSTKLTDLSGSTLTAVNDVDVILYNGTLFVAISGTRSSGGPGFNVYTLNPNTGEWGIRLSSPGTTTAQDGLCVKLSKSGSNAFLIFGHASAPRATLHQIDLDALSIGAKASDPASSINGGVNAIDIVVFGNGTRAAFLATDTTPFLNAYPISPGPSFGTKFSNPAALAGIGRSISVTRREISGTRYVLVGHDTTPFFSILPATSSAFSTKLSNPPTLPSAAGRGVAWAPGAAAFAVAQDAATSPLGYAFDMSTPAIGTQYPNFDPPASSGGRAVAYSSDGRWLAAGHSTTPFLLVCEAQDDPANGEVDVLMVLGTNMEAASDFRLQLDDDSAFGSNAYDTGSPTLLPMFPAGTTNDILTHYPASFIHVIPSGSSPPISVPYARVILRDRHADTADNFTTRPADEVAIIALFKAWQPEVNVVSWSPLTEPLSIRSPRGLGNVRVESRRTRRGIRATYGWLEDAEILALHHLLMQIPAVPVLAIGFPEDGDHNFQTAVWGLMEVDDPEYDPEFELWSVTIRVWEQV